MGADSAIETVDGMTDLRVGASEGAAGVPKFSSKPKWEGWGEIKEAIQWERAQTCC